MRILEPIIELFQRPTYLEASSYAEFLAAAPQSSVRHATIVVHPLARVDRSDRPAFSLYLRCAGRVRIEYHVPDAWRVRETGITMLRPSQIAARARRLDAAIERARELLAHYAHRIGVTLQVGGTNHSIERAEVLYDELQCMLYDYTPRSFYEPANYQSRRVTGMS